MLGRHAALETTPGPRPMCPDQKRHGVSSHRLDVAPGDACRQGRLHVRAGWGTDASSADPSFYQSLPQGADPDTSVPYINGAGTPCPHPMPVK